MSDNAFASVLTVEVERSGSTAMVRCRGMLVVGVTDVLYLKVRQLIPPTKPDTKRIVLDLTDLARMDSTGLGTLVRLYASARSAGCDLELVNLSQQVRRLLNLTNLLSVFTVVGEHHIKMG